MKKKEHSSNFIPSIYDLFGWGVAYHFAWPSGWALILGWPLIQINTILQYKVL